MNCSREDAKEFSFPGSVPLLERLRPTRTGGLEKLEGGAIKTVPLAPPAFVLSSDGPLLESSEGRPL